MRNWLPGMGSPNTPHAEFLPRYQQLRQVGMQLNNRLVKTLPKHAIEEGGKKLGIFKKNTLVLNAEDELSVLMDFCLYDIRSQGINAVERFVQETPPPGDSEEMVLLQAMLQAYYSLFVVEASEHGVGVQVRDLLRDESLFLMDRGLGQTAPPGMVLAARVMAPEGMHMTTGAALPVREIPAEQLDQVVPELMGKAANADWRNLSSENASEVTATLIRSLLQEGVMEVMRYGNMETVSEPATRKLPSTPRRRGKPGRPRRGRQHQRCPCGSGRMYKNCCEPRQ